MSPPGYYKVNYRALRLKELIRWYGLGRGIRSDIDARSLRSTGGNWMPALWKDTECERSALSNEFWGRTKHYRLAMEKLGFAECGCSKSTKSLYEQFEEAGSVCYLDPSKRYVSRVIYLRHRAHADGSQPAVMFVSFTAVLAGGNLTFTNRKRGFDPIETDEVVRVQSCDVESIHQLFIKRVHEQEEKPRQFSDIESLRAALDAHVVQRFEERVRRRLFVPMTEQEVAKARENVEARNRGERPKRRQGLQIGFWPMFIVAIAALQFFRYSHVKVGDPIDDQKIGDTIDYQGRQFKMSRAYASYDDYKDDPNNLNTNELGRIEQLMVSAPFPKAFPDEKAFFHALFDLKFPGYGLSTGVESAHTDDGSILMTGAVEIPQRDKDRYLIMRRSGGPLNLVDDFVFGPSENGVHRITLEKGVLRYYDRNGHVVREKHLSTAL